MAVTGYQSHKLGRHSWPALPPQISSSSASCLYSQSRWAWLALPRMTLPYFWKTAKVTAVENSSRDPVQERHETQDQESPWDFLKTKARGRNSFFLGWRVWRQPLSCGEIGGSRHRIKSLCYNECLSLQAPGFFLVSAPFRSFWTFSRNLPLNPPCDLMFQQGFCYL